jgi:hypothetical protein
MSMGFATQEDGLLQHPMRVCSTNPSTIARFALSVTTRVFMLYDSRLSPLACVVEPHETNASSLSHGIMVSTETPLGVNLIHTGTEYLLLYIIIIRNLPTTQKAVWCNGCTLSYLKLPLYPYILSERGVGSIPATANFSFLPLSFDFIFLEKING